MEHLDPPSSQIKVGKILDYFGVMRASSKQAISTALSVLPGIRAEGPVIIYVGDFMLRDNIVTRMFKLGLDFMRQ